MTRPLPESAPEFFGAMHEAYDDLIVRCVPRYAEMIDRLIHFLPDSPTRILELGCGTGNVTARLAERSPDATITVVDASDAMAAHTTARLGDRVMPVVGRFEEVQFEEQTFDLVVSSISLHHVADKAPVFAQVARWLVSGGEFWFADQFAGATKVNHQRNWDDWLAFCRLEGNCSEDEIRELLDHAEAHDHYESVAQHFSYLRAAGFDPTSLDCVWRNLIWGILGATKA